MRKSTILISFFLLFLLISVIPLRNIVVATAYPPTFSYDFESSTITHQVLFAENGFFYTHESVGSFEVSNEPYTGAKGFSVGGNFDNNGYINLSYSPSKYMTNFSFWFNMDFTYYLYFNMGSTATILRFYFAVNVVYYFDTVNVMHTVANGLSGWNKFGFDIISNDTIYYYVGATGGNGEPRNVIDIPRIDSIIIDDDGTDILKTLDIDDINVTFSPSSTVTAKSILRVNFIDANSMLALPVFNLSSTMNKFSLNGYISGDLFNYPYDINSSDNHVGVPALTSKFEVNAFTSGDYLHTLYITGAYRDTLIGDEMVRIYYEDYSPIGRYFYSSGIQVLLKRKGMSSVGNDTTIGDDNGNSTVKIRFRDTLGLLTYFQYFGEWGSCFDDYPYVYTLYGNMLWWNDTIDNGIGYNLSSQYDYIKFSNNFTDGTLFNFQFYNLWSYTPTGDKVFFNTVWWAGTLSDGDILTIQLAVAYYENKTTGDISKIPITPPSLMDYITPYKLYIGIGITVGMSLLPLIAGMLLAKKTSVTFMDIPALVYVAFFLMGIVISCVLGYFEIWVIFFVLFALILVFAITWIQGKSNSG
jgi:hypothetical protein